MDAFLENMIGLSLPTRIAITTEQGLDRVQVFEELSRDDIDDLCKTARRPGGLISNPLAGIPGNPPLMMNPGVAVPAISVKRLKMCSFSRSTW